MKFHPQVAKEARQLNKYIKNNTDYDYLQSKKEIALNLKSR